MVLGEEESRFSFLLKPIRDLTKNWDVDIASHLEEYLEELENVAITFDGGRTMNFAEAALLIQGSTCVYSRKVEYLYLLVYEVLDLLVNKKRNKQDNAKNGNENVADPDITFNDEDIQILPLDDLQEMVIVMKGTEKAIGTIPRRPMSMVPFREEMGDVQLMSKNGEVLGSRNDFRLNTSQVNPESCLLLEASAQILSQVNKSHDKFGEPLSCDGKAFDTEMNNNDDDVDTGFPACDDDDDLRDDCHELEEIPLPETKEIDMNEGPKQSERIQKMMLQDKNKFSAPQKLDPWDHQDPFEPKKMTEKAFKKSKTFRIPDALNEKKSKKRKRTTTDDEKSKDQVLVGEFIAVNLFSYKMKIPKVLQESCLPEFEKLCWSKLSERQSKQKIEIKAMETILEQQILESEHNQDECAEIVANVNEGGICGDDDDDEDVGPVLNWQDDLFNVELEPEIADPPDDEPASSYEQLVQKHIEAFYVGAQKYAQITELSKRISDWEARILPKLQEEETYGPFDIHVYGTKVLGSVTKGSKISLSKIMAGKPAHEVGRLFLSTLMLANAGNVELSCPGVLDEGMDKAEVTLLRTKLHFEELETYIAPSLANKDNKEN